MRIRAPVERRLKAGERASSIAVLEGRGRIPEPADGTLRPSSSAASFTSLMSILYATTVQCVN